LFRQRDQKKTGVARKQFSTDVIVIASGCFAARQSRKVFNQIL